MTPRVPIVPSLLLLLLLLLVVAATPIAAQNQTVQSSEPTLWFLRDPGSYEWLLRTVQLEANNVFQLVDMEDNTGESPTVVLRVHDSDVNQNSFVVQPDGQVRLAAAALTVDRASGRVGIGTTTPALQELQIADPSPGIWLQDTTAGALGFGLFTDGDEFSIGGSPSLHVLNPVRIANDAPAGSLRIDSAGFVGIGTTAPTSMLHVAGSGRIDGDVALGSSRRLKTAFAAVSTADVLTRLTRLPILSWRYKTEDEAVRHIGPFAEDFQRLFGLGDGRTISIVDAQGVAFAAIQELQQRLADREDELARLRDERDAEIAGLTARLEALESVLSEVHPPAHE